MKLGLDVEELPGASHLPIREINGGLAMKWNEEHSVKINKGDRIVQVNGVANDVAAMMKKCRTDKVLRMCIMPAGAQGSAGSVTVSTAALHGYAQSVPATASAPSAAPYQAPYEAPAAAPYQMPTAQDHYARQNQAPAGPTGNVSPTGNPTGNPTGQRGAPTFVPSGSAMDKMMELGIPEARALEALEIAGNDLNLALEVCGHSPGATGGGPAPAPPARNAPSPQRPEAPRQQNNGVRQLVEMGYPEAQAARALNDHNGDIDAALAVLMSGGGESPAGGGRGGGGGAQDATREKMKTLTEMGFAEDACHQALQDTGGDLDQAMAMLLSAS